MKTLIELMMRADGLVEHAPDSATASQQAAEIVADCTTREQFTAVLGADRARALLPPGEVDAWTPEALDGARERTRDKLVQLWRTTTLRTLREAELTQAARRLQGQAARLGIILNETNARRIIDG